MIQPADHSKRSLYLMYGGIGLVFAALAVMVKTGTSGWLDGPLIWLIAGHRSDWLTPVMKLATDLGSSPTILAAAAILVAGLVTKRKHYDYILVVIGVAGAVGLNAVLKAIFERVRPSGWVHLVVENGLSFPSGHAMASSALAISIIYLVWHSRWRNLAVAVGALYMLAVGTSRVYLGVHYPSDVIAGWCVSWLWVATVASWLNLYRSDGGKAKIIGG